MTLSKSYIGALLVALAGIIFWILLLPAYDNVVAQREAIAERADILKDRQDTINKIKNLTQEYAKRATDISRFTSIVPAQKSAPELISALQALATQNGLQLTNIALSGNANQDKNVYQEQSIDLGLVGNYPAFKSFIMAVERNIRLIDIKTIGASPIAENSTNISFKLKGNAYFIKQ